MSGDGIFLSYRRDDSAGWTRGIYDRLRTAFDPARVFMDVDSLRPGADYEEVIEDTLADCAVVVAVIGRSWVSAVDGRGRRRLDDPNDLLVLEVAAALERRTNVVPVLVDGASMPATDELPERIQALTRRHALEMSPRAFDRDVDVLVEQLRGIVAPARTPDATAPPAPAVAAPEEVEAPDARGAAPPSPPSPGDPAAAALTRARELRDARDRDGAKEAYREAVATGDVDQVAEARLQLAELHSWDDELDAAERELRLVIDASPGTRQAMAAWLGLADVLADRDDLPGSVWAYGRVIDGGDAEQRANALNSLGVELRHADRLDEAVSTFRDAVEVGHPPYSDMAAVNLAATIGERGDLTQARRLLQQEIERGDVGQQALALLELGRLLADAGAQDDAVAAFRRCAELDAGPSSAAARHHLAKLEARR